MHGRNAERRGEETREAEDDEKSREGGRSRSESEQLDRRWAGCSERPGWRDVVKAANQKNACMPVWI